LYCNDNIIYRSDTTYFGEQENITKGQGLYAWAVRSGDVTTSPVPVPAAFWLMASGLLGMAGLRKKR
jgi:hypothetical protein